MKPKEYRLNWHQRIYISILCVYRVMKYGSSAVLFKKEEDAVKFRSDLENRVAEYDLVLNQDKTKLLTLKKQEHNHFNFLGFTFYWGKQGSKIMLKVKTQKEKLLKSIQDFTQWIKEARNKGKLKEIWAIAKAKIRGHINYFGYWMNGLKIHHFYYEVMKSLFKWLNRRSQKRSYDWPGFERKAE